MGKKPTETTIDRLTRPNRGELDFFHKLSLRSNQRIFVPVDSYPSDEDPTQIIDNLGILSIAFRLPSPEAAMNPKTVTGLQNLHINEEGDYACVYKMVQFPDNNQQLSGDAITSVLDKALRSIKRKKVHYILFNELACSFQNVNTLLAQIRETVYCHDHAKQAVIIPGSYHCENTCHNLSPIMFSPDPGDIHLAPKQSAAGKQMEVIRTPDGATFYTFTTPFGKIAVWICLDMYDPSLVRRLIYNNFKSSIYNWGRKPVDLVFVPSYNKDGLANIDMAGIGISKFGRTTVVIANDWPASVQRSRHPSYGIDDDTSPFSGNLCYFFGESQKPDQIDLGSMKHRATADFFSLDWRERDRQLVFDPKKELSSYFCSMFGVTASAIR